MNARHRSAALLAALGLAALTMATCGAFGTMHDAGAVRGTTRGERL